MNIYDIAKECGVSIATVSRVLNGSAHVRPNTREKVQAAMARAGYHPNAFARSLGTGASARTVGILCPDIRDGFCAAAVGHLEDALRERGFHSLLRCTGYTPAAMTVAMEHMSSQNIDAILVIHAPHTENADDTHLTEMARRLPVIMINCRCDLPGIHSIIGDERQAVAALVEQILLRKRQRVLLLHGAPTYSSRQILLGFQDGCDAFRLPKEEQQTAQVAPHLDAINQCIKQLLMQRARFDAVLATEDLLAVGAQKALVRIGLSMPVIGFHNTPLAVCASPEITSIDSHPEDMCTAALNILDARLQGQEAPALTVIPVQLVERNSFRL